MSKLRQIVWVIAGVVMTYLIIGVSILFISDNTVSVNTEIAAAHNMTNYPGTSGFLLSIPWILYIAPAVIGIAIIIWVLKHEEIEQAITRVSLR